MSSHSEVRRGQGMGPALMYLYRVKSTRVSSSR